jgi:hypothetical protein
VTLQIYRVIVRGKFDRLDDAIRGTLLADAADHDVTRAAFRADGTFTYDARLVAFSFRYELRESGDDPERAVVDRARVMAESSLVALGVGFRDLRVEAINMADVWRR